MQENPTHESVAQQLDREERLVLDLLLSTTAAPAVWSQTEIARALGCELAAADAVMGLHAAGLVHRFEEFVFATRAALRFDALANCL